MGGQRRQAHDVTVASGNDDVIGRKRFDVGQSDGSTAYLLIT